jgi:hypothetical protein
MAEDVDDTSALAPVEGWEDLIAEFAEDAFVSAPGGDLGAAALGDIAASPPLAARAPAGGPMSSGSSGSAMPQGSIFSAMQAGGSGRGRGRRGRPPAYMRTLQDFRRLRDEEPARAAGDAPPLFAT